jgi:hypothetical protein
VGEDCPSTADAGEGEEAEEGEEAAAVEKKAVETENHHD